MLADDDDCSWPERDGDESSRRGKVPVERLREPIGTLCVDRELAGILWLLLDCGKASQRESSVLQPWLRKSRRRPGKCRQLMGSSATHIFHAHTFEHVSQVGRPVKRGLVRPGRMESYGTTGATDARCLTTYWRSGTQARSIKRSCYSFMIGAGRPTVTVAQSLYFLFPRQRERPALR